MSFCCVAFFFQSELWACGQVEIRPTADCSQGVVFIGSATVAIG
jgi:hypothetical protein